MNSRCAPSLAATPQVRNYSDLVDLLDEKRVGDRVKVGACGRDALWRRVVPVACRRSAYRYRNAIWLSLLGATLVPGMAQEAL